MRILNLHGILLALLLTTASLLGMYQPGKSSLDLAWEALAKTKAANLKKRWECTITAAYVSLVIQGDEYIVRTSNLTPWCAQNAIYQNSTKATIYDDKLKVFKFPTSKYEVYCDKAQAIVYRRA